MYQVTVETAESKTTLKGLFPSLEDAKIKIRKLERGYLIEERDSEMRIFDEKDWKTTYTIEQVKNTESQTKLV